MKTFLVVSDIHSVNHPPEAHDCPSFVSSQRPDKDLDDPFFRALEVLPKQVDAVICPGDITDKAEPDALLYAWRKLAELANTLDAKLIATVGNHDLDSRYKHDDDPRGLVMSLTPQFPVDDYSLYLEYWAKHYVITKDDSHCVLVLNTAASHGGGIDPKIEMETGRISTHTLSRIKDDLSKLDTQEYGILLCHHHLVLNNEINEQDYSDAHNGPQLLSMLEKTGIPWMVVHGHKHRPKLFYAPGGGNSPVILSSASFSSNIRRDTQNLNPNQMHLVSIDTSTSESLGASLYGKVESWNWLPQLGWKKANYSMGLPNLSGFGARTPIKTVVTNLLKLLDIAETKVLRWNQVSEEMPELKFLLPSDISIVESRLKMQGVAVIRDSYGGILEFGVENDV